MNSIYTEYRTARVIATGEFVYLYKCMGTPHQGARYLIGNGVWIHETQLDQYCY